MKLASDREFRRATGNYCRERAEKYTPARVRYHFYNILYEIDPKAFLYPVITQSREVVDGLIEKGYVEGPPTKVGRVWLGDYDDELKSKETREVKDIGEVEDKFIIPVRFD